MLAGLGMHVRSVERVRRERLEQLHPAHVQRLEQRQRDFHRQSSRVGELRPERFLVGSDRGTLLGEGEAQAHVRIEMAVRDVMDDLSDRPAARAVRLVELIVR